MSKQDIVTKRSVPQVDEMAPREVGFPVEKKGEVDEGRQAAELLRVVEQETRELEAGLGVLEGIEDGADEETIVEASQLREEIEEVKRGFRERIRTWWTQKHKVRQDKKDVQRERDLGIIDNQKIIKDLEKRLERVKKKADLLRNKEISQIKKNTKKPVEYEEQRTMFDRAALSQAGELVALGTDYHKATKEDLGKWREINGQIDLLLSAGARAAIADGDFEKAVEMIKIMPKDSERNYDVSLALFNKIMSSYGVHEGHEIQPADNVAELRVRFQLHDQIKAEALRLFETDALLTKRFDEYSSPPSSEWNTRVMLPGELALKQYGDDAVDSFYQIDEISRVFVLGEMVGNKKEGWKRALQQKEKFMPYVQLVIEVHACLGDYPDFQPGDHVFTQKAVSISGAKREEAMEKTKSLLLKSKNLDWAEVYGCLLAGSVADISAEELEKIPFERIKVLAALPVIFGDDKLTQALTKEELRSWSTYTDFSYDWRKSYWDSRRSTFDSYTADKLVTFARGATPNVRAYACASQPYRKWKNSEETDEIGVTQLVVGLGNLEYTVEAVPENLREKFFSSIKPERAGGHNHEHVSQLFKKGCVSNYWECLELMGEEHTLSLQSLLNTSGIFEDTSWEEVSKGIRNVIREVPACIPTLDVTNRKTLEGLRRVAAEGTEVGKAMTLFKYFTEGRDSFVKKKRKRYSNEYTYENVTRGPDMVDMYLFTDFVEKYFREDSDAMVKIFSATYSLDELEIKALQLYLDGKFSPGQGQYYDTPVLEGCLYSIMDRCTGSGAKELSDATKYLDEISVLTKEEKDLYIGFSDFFGACDVQIIREGNAAALVEIARKFPDVKFPIDTYKKMLERPDCIGLYYYLPSFEIRGFDHGDTSHKEILDKLTQLNDQGLDRRYYSSQCVLRQGDKELSHYALKDMLEYDAEAIVFIANLVAQYNPHASFHDVLYLIAGTGKKTLADAQSAEERFIKQAHIGAFSGTRDYLFPYDEQEILLYDLDGVKKNIQRAEAVLGRPLQIDERRHFTKDFVYAAYAPVVEKITSSREILELFLKNKKRDYSLSGIESVDEVYLRDKVFWSYLPSSDTMKDSALLELHMRIAHLFVDSGIEVATEGNNWWNFLYKSYEKNPLVFSDGFLSVFKGQKIHANALVDLADRIPSDLSDSMMSRIKRYLHLASPGSSEFRNFLAEAGSEKCESELDMLEDFQEKLGAGSIEPFIPYAIKLISEGKNAEQIIQQIDELLPSEEAPYSEGFEKKTGIRGYNLFEQWWVARNRGGLEPVKSILPKTIEKILEPLMTSQNKQLREFYSLTPELNSLTAECAARLELLAGKFEKPPNSYRTNYLENLVTIAKSPNFEHVFGILSSERIEEIFASDPQQVAHFCNGCSEIVAERIFSLPDCVTYRLADAADYLADPSFPQMVEFVQKMKEIFGEKFTISIYQLLLMDFSVDLENIKELEAGCSQRPLTPEMLKRLRFGLDDASVRDSVDKTMTAFDNYAVLPLERVLPAVAKLGPELRWQAIFNNIGNLGWNLLLHHMDYLEEKMEFSDEQVSKLVVKLYEHNARPEAVSFKVFRLLWDAGNRGEIRILPNEYGNEYMARILAAYQGDPDELLGYISRDGAAVMKKVHYSSFPEFFKDSALFWRLLAESDPREILMRSQEMPKGVLDSDTWRKALRPLIKDSPDLLWMHRADIPFVEGEFEALIDSSIEKGNSSTVAHILLESVNGAIELSEAKKDDAIEHYIKRGGDLNFLRIDQSQEDLSESQKKFVPLFRSFTDKLIRRGIENIAEVIELLNTFADSNALPLEYMSAVLEFANILSETDTELNKKIEELEVKMILQFDPTIRSSFNDPNKLGRIKSLVVSHLVEHVTKLQENQTPQEEMIRILRTELLKIKRIYDSSDSTESDRRLIFRDLYSFEQCQDLTPALANVPPEKKKHAAEEIVVEDLHEVLILSGCKREIRTETDRARAGQALQMADARNRQLAEQTKAEERHNLSLPHGALTHGLPAHVLEMVLEVGNLSGELLGSGGKTDASGLLGVDTSQVVTSDENSFADKYRALMNLGYGQIHLIYGDYHNERRKPYHSGAIGSDHELVRVGIPSTEITGMIIKNDTLLQQVKEDIAGKGFYIPILDTQGKLLFEPAEFDQMKVFYHSLTQHGYPREVAKNVYEYYKTLEGKSDTKHAVVLNKAVEAAVSGELVEDLAILVDFLRTNDLNSRSLEWYQKSSLADILKVIKKSVGVKSRERARTLLFGSQSNQRRRLGESVSRQTKEPIVRQSHSFIDAFEEKQIPFIGEETGEYDKALVDLLFKRNSFERLQEVSTLFTEQKKKLMRTLWNNVWDDLEKDPAWAEKSEELKRYKEIIIPTIAGSGGRGEIVLGSDLDYNLIVDDRNIPEQGDTRVQLLSRLSNFVNTVLAERINAVLEHNDIRADAGLAKEDRQPFMLMSTIESFTIDVNKRRQTEEPTEIVDSEPLFVEQRHVVQDAREALLAKNQSSYLLESFVLRDLERGLGKQSFIESFEELYKSAASGKILDKIKESLQRTVTFKIYHLMFRAFETSGAGGIDKSESRDIPSTTTGKVDFLVEHNVLSGEEAKTCKELLLMAYKLRFLGELYSDEAQEKGLKKVKNVKFRLDEFSYEEREELFAMLRRFRETVLYK
ncbi:MAG: DUF294 nucleotidyltransferase-like domain-containing protein [Candidatus Magasanikbacteria bacterium]